MGLRFLSKPCSDGFVSELHAIRAEASGGLEKRAYVSASLMRTSSTSTERAWSDAYKDTPFHERAIAISKEETRGDVEEAERELERAIRSVKRAEIRAACARLDMALIEMRGDKLSKEEKQKLSAELAAYRDGGLGIRTTDDSKDEEDTKYEWIDHFRGTPLLQDALDLSAEEMAFDVEEAGLQADRDQFSNWSPERRIRRLALELEYRMWRSKMGERTPRRGPLGFSHCY